MASTATAYLIEGVTFKSLFSWPPNPALTGFQAGTRVLLLLNDAIGIGLCLAAGIKRRHGASANFAGIFMCAACALVFIQLRWNIRTLRGVNDMRKQYGLLDTEDKQDPDQKPTGTRMLKFSTKVDLLGFLAFLVVYPIMVSEAYNTYRGLAVLYSYASVSALIPLIIHFILLSTQYLQLKAAKPARKPSCMHCPHCNRTAPRYTPSSSVSVPTKGIGSENQTLHGQDPFRDMDDNDTADGPAPGQQTGTCDRTPKESTSADEMLRRPSAGSSMANETGEGEGESLIEKSE